MEYIQVFTTTERKADAEIIAKALVEKRLAGCVQIIGPIESTYWWEGNIEKTREWICFIKSKRALFDKLEKAVKGLHPYKTPEIIALPIVIGNWDYLQWLRSELGE